MGPRVWLVSFLLIILLSSSYHPILIPQAEAQTAYTIIYDNVGSGNNGGGASSISWSHTVGSGATLMAIGVSIRTITVSVTYVDISGVNATFVRTDTSGTQIKLETWVLYNPPSGAKTVTVHLSGTTKAAGGSLTYLNTGIADTFQINSGNSATPYCNLTTATNNELVLSSYGIQGNPTVNSHDSGQNHRYYQVTTGGLAATRNVAEGDDEIEASSGAHSYQITLNGAWPWIVHCAAFKPNFHIDPKLTQTLAFGDSLTRSVGTITKSITQVLAFGSSVAASIEQGVQTLFRPLTETLAFESLASRSVDTITRSIEQTLAFSSSAVGNIVGTLNRFINQALAFGDQITRSASSSITIAQELLFGDSLTRSLGTVTKTLTETLVFGSSVLGSVPGILNRFLTETLAFGVPALPKMVWVMNPTTCAVDFSPFVLVAIIAVPIGLALLVYAKKR